MSAYEPHELLAETDPEATKIAIAGVKLTPIEYDGRRVLTLAMMDKVHQRPKDTSRRNFNEHRRRLIVGEDFYELNQPDDIRTLGLTRPQGGTPATVLLLTETGYSMLVKSFQDDLAWEVQRQLVRSYFAKPAQMRTLTPAEMFLQNAQMMVDIERRQLAQGVQLDRVEQRVEELADTMVVRTRPAGSESITHMRPRAAKMFGLPERIVEYVVRQSPMAIKPACMVRNEREEAEGGSFAVYWVKDVNAVLRRFIGECKMATACMATHPYVEGRFKMVSRGQAQLGFEPPAYDN